MVRLGMTTTGEALSARRNATPAHYVRMHGKRECKAGQYKASVDDHEPRIVNQFASDVRARQGKGAHHERHRSRMKCAANVTHCQHTAEYDRYPLEHLRPAGGSVILNQCAIIGRAHPR